MGTNSHIILTNKPKDVTSFRSLGSIKKHVDKKVGHAGTLDKFAHGLMIVLTGSTTKLNQLFSILDKTYIATIRFCSQTTTLDVVKEHFIGKIMQAPPLYSAIHVDGKRAYKIARSGKNIEMAEREVSIYSFDIISYNNLDLVCKIKVSKGTYIRSIARDLALSCNSRGYLVDLVRTSIGPFQLEEAVDTETKEDIQKGLYKTDEYLKKLDSVSIYKIDDKYLFDLSNGKKPNYSQLQPVSIKNDAFYAAIYTNDDILRCVLKLDEDKNIEKILCQINPCFDRG